MCELIELGTILEETQGRKGPFQRIEPFTGVKNYTLS